MFSALMKELIYPIYICLSILTILSCQKDGNYDAPNPLDTVHSAGLSRLSNVRIAILGDSISTFDGFSPSNVFGYDGIRYKAYYPKGDVQIVNNMWWYKVALSLGIDPASISNCSWSGSYITGDSSSTTNAYAGCSYRRVSDLAYKGIPDIVICFISCNDWANGVSIGNWMATDMIPKSGIVSTMREAYALMISRIRESYPESIIICMTILDDTKRDKTIGWPSNNSKGVTIEEWNNNIKEVSLAFGCYTIELQDAGINYYNITSLTVDNGLHPNAAGMTLIAEKVTKEINTILSSYSSDSN